jgi:hypothetical protein
VKLPSPVGTDQDTLCEHVPVPVQITVAEQDAVFPVTIGFGVHDAAEIDDGVPGVDPI